MAEAMKNGLEDKLIIHVENMYTLQSGDAWSYGPNLKYQLSKKQVCN